MPNGQDKNFSALQWNDESQQPHAHVALVLGQAPP